MTRSIAGTSPGERGAGCARNRGAAGIDGHTIEQIEDGGVAAFLDDLERELKDGSYRISPTVRDRVVQAAVKIVIEPIFEADFMECSFGYRPERSPHDALQV